MKLGKLLDIRKARLFFEDSFLFKETFLCLKGSKLKLITVGSKFLRTVGKPVQMNLATLKIQIVRVRESQRNLEI